jgi:methionyl aminopeptidase
MPSHIGGPEYAFSGRPGDSSNSIYIHSAEEVPKLRKSARLARKVLEFALSHAKPGVSTDAIDKLAHEEILKHGAYPSPMNYYGFPKSICTSVNEVVCHGIPDNRVLQEGDIISIDVSVYLDGYHGDNCGTVVVGKGDPKLQHLIQSTKDAVQKAIEVCKPGG